MLIRTRAIDPSLPFLSSGFRNSLSLRGDAPWQGPVAAAHQYAVGCRLEQPTKSLHVPLQCLSRDMGPLWQYAHHHNKRNTGLPECKLPTGRHLSLNAAHVPRVFLQILK